ncbi:uncharacterized protein NECHADRAFT_85969 [Fusarium vanettenii 77-13-4]|uniref:Uncharacterized protein n=1 Tax=Fusarium vanettenii (strain ATCC MYA-4622 / CBS 123669 / FGSC 9596 / NRRL 45880 / 77-13-4) TaxID=660122 RepID=C7Z1Z5_FUSV7|nr:uncharacterized protein NECHADRAFT_85969 [Fusarium vanettenii 77-13-4]EEU41912.1 predicted protein [Fusarium vanettenii 77-13-4]
MGYYGDARLSVDHPLLIVPEHGPDLVPVVHGAAHVYGRGALAIQPPPPVEGANVMSVQELSGTRMRTLTMYLPPRTRRVLSRGWLDSVLLSVEAADNVSEEEVVIPLRDEVVKGGKHGEANTPWVKANSGRAHISDLMVKKPTHKKIASREKERVAMKTYKG